MPRRQFVADLQQTQQGELPLGINDVQAGNDDGQFEFTFAAQVDDDPKQTSVRITAIVPELSEYPKSHEYMLFCSDDAPLEIGETLQKVRGTARKTVFELLDIVSVALSGLHNDADGDAVMPDSQFDDEQYEGYDEQDVYGSDDEAFITGAPAVRNDFAAQAASTSSHVSLASEAFTNRLRSDLRATKAAGFHVGILGNILDGGRAYVTISIRMSKLGISEEAMQAWQVESAEYLILVIQYSRGYKTNEQLQGYDGVHLKSNLAARVFSGQRYKPSLEDVVKSFNKEAMKSGAARRIMDASESELEHTNSIRDTFISKPLVGLLEEHLVPILRFRSKGLNWSGAEACLQDILSMYASDKPDATTPDKYRVPELPNKALPAVVRGDQYTEFGVSEYSFPLLAMQYTLRHFVRCTEFCLVCHRKVESELEAIKPYVCDRPLCLFQYMAMGFGPSIEHEITTQPYVVDLLVSFCYNSAFNSKLKDFPIGLGMMVPVVTAPPSSLQANNFFAQQIEPTALPKAEPVRYEVGFDRERRELIFFDKPDGGCPVSRGSWIVIEPGGTIDGHVAELHCRIVETTFYPTITIDQIVEVQQTSQNRQDPENKLHGGVLYKESDSKKPVTPALTPKWSIATFTRYDQDFDQLEQAQKCVTMARLLETLPSILEMRDCLRKRNPADLSRWVERISPSALSLLRWIIASNRACIMQVDELGEPNKAVVGNERSAGASKQERLYGMKDYMQFRFAMGAPDKEQRFRSAVQTTKDRLKLKYPTIFAWHGSPLHNWHMIIREGLHFKNKDHGRAYGDGVYHAKEAQTSLGYSNMVGRFSDKTCPPGAWPRSVLRVSTAIALNELVNAPSEFANNHPYYVVAQLDWIQTRYLFVQCAPTEGGVKIGVEVKAKHVYAQDPARTPRGISDAIVIPASAIKTNRVQKVQDEDDDEDEKQSAAKKLKGASGKAIGIFNDSEEEGDESEADDFETLFDDSHDSTAVSTADEGSALLRSVPSLKKSRSMTLREKTNATTSTWGIDFTPGSLDWSSLPLMPMPSYANSASTKRLMKEVQAMRDVMQVTPQGELGWHVEVERIENVYQWIVELHAFDKFEVKSKPLPLVDDMKKKGVKSVVLEVRFGGDYPFSPPYIRIVRPRFLSFAQGGGGHIVMGGAMCMELLTNTGWSAINSMESVLMQVRLAIASEPFARLDMRGHGDYGTAEAAEGFIRACRTHGWAEPPGFKQIAYGMDADS